jgi:hypothetical protein
MYRFLISQSLPIYVLYSVTVVEVPDGRLEVVDISILDQSGGLQIIQVVLARTLQKPN